MIYKIQAILTTCYFLNFTRHGRLAIYHCIALQSLFYIGHILLQHLLRASEYPRGFDIASSCLLVENVLSPIARRPTLTLSALLTTTYLHLCTIVRTFFIIDESPSYPARYSQDIVIVASRPHRGHIWLLSASL